MNNDLPGLAHDLNNVFQTLAGVAAQLEHDPELADAIVRSVERGREIVAGMQRDDAATTPFETVAANAASFLQDFRAATNGPAVTIDSHVEPGIVTSGDALSDLSHFMAPDASSFTAADVVRTLLTDA